MSSSGPTWRSGPALADRLPDFPWDTLAPLADLARRHPDGVIDLSVGTPVDPCPPLVQAALSAASDAHGYPTVAGPVGLRAACAQWLGHVSGADVAPSAVLPTVGSKELVASLPRQLGLRPGARVVVPRIAYPTYAVGALLADCEVVVSDEPESLAGPVDLVWLNSPGNPTGGVLSVDRLAEIVAWARASEVVVASDECYLTLGWDADPVSILDPRVCGGAHDGLLAVHSLSKRSNMAGYRFGFVAGDERIVGDLLEVRKHSGLMVPAPVQAAAIAALGNEQHVEVQRERYRRRREVLRSALTAAGFRIDDSAAGLYLWSSRDEPCWDTVTWLAERGILVAPGDFYGSAGARHVRVAFTASDERVDLVPGRIART